MGQTVPKAKYPGLLCVSFHFVTMQMCCYNAMKCPVRGLWDLAVKEVTYHLLLAVGWCNILVSQMYRSFIIFWPVELSCGRLGAIHLCSDNDKTKHVH